MVFDFKLHEAHVGRVCELRDDAESWEQPERGGKRHSERIACTKKIE